MEMRELVELLAKNIAREVTDQLKESEIVPLAARVSDLEQRLIACKAAHRADEASPPADDTTLTVVRWKGALDALWKVGLVLWVVVQVYMKVKRL
jgi:hypothetical protein